VLPAATVALILMLAASAALSYGMFNGTFWRAGFYDWYRNRAFAQLAPDVRALVEANEGTADAQTAVAKRLADQHPDDRALYANYASAAARREMFQRSNGAEDPEFPIVNEPLLQETLAIIAEGERRDPDNAFYPLQAATLLFEASSAIAEDPTQEIRRPGAKREECWWTLKVRKPDRFAQALALFDRAIAKPQFRNYDEELLRRKIDGMPRPRRLPELAFQASAIGGTRWPLQGDQTIYSMLIHATDAARAGRVAEANDIVKKIRHLAALILADTHRTDHTSYVLSFDTSADEAAARIAMTIGDARAAEEAWKRFEATKNSHRAARQAVEARRNVAVAGAAAWNYYLPQDADLTSVWRAESAASHQLGFAILSTAGLALAVVYAVAALPAWLMSPRGAKPPRLFIGRRRMARVIALGVGLPVVLFFAGGWLWEMLTRQHDLNVRIDRVVLKYGVLAAVILLATHTLLRRAIAARAAELGVSLPPPPPNGTRRRLAIFALAASPLIVIAVAVSPAASLVTLRDKTAQSLIQFALLAAFWIVLAVVVVRLASAARRRGWPGAIPLAGSLPRSAFPVAAVAALMLALLGLPMRWSESRAMDVAGGKSLLLPSDPARSPYAALTEQLLAREGVARR
jgi:hypothetical protein